MAAEEYVKIRSIYEEKLSRICAGSFIIYFSTSCDVIFSNTVPWEIVVSLKYRLFDCALKPLIATTRKGLFGTLSLSENFSNSTCVPLGYL